MSIMRNEKELIKILKESFELSRHDQFGLRLNLFDSARLSNKLFQAIQMLDPTFQIWSKNK